MATQVTNVAGPASTGINRYTGAKLSDWPHVQQSVEVIFTTRISSRVMRRSFGAAVPNIFLQNLTVSTFVRLFSAICHGLELWEPRARVVKAVWPADNTPEKMRLGKIHPIILCQYRPHALLGDFTPEPGLRKIVLTL